MSHAADFARDVRSGLARPGQKVLAPAWLYDDLGSALFEAICALPEYGLSRAGDRLLAAHAAELSGHLAGPCRVVELGPGSGRKLRRLVEVLPREDVLSCTAVDISDEALARTRAELARVEGLEVVTIPALFRGGLRQAVARRKVGERALVLFLGSNIGNYDDAEAHVFLRDVHAALQAGDLFLLGADLVKPAEVLERAYDDELGVTAAFNKNLLVRMNRELDARFDLGRFEHVARWNEDQSRVEMHLRSIVVQEVAIPGADLRVGFQRDETIWTEGSRKFELAALERLGVDAGFRPAARWTDAEWPFAHVLFEAI